MHNAFYCSTARLLILRHESFCFPDASFVYVRAQRRGLLCFSLSSSRALADPISPRLLNYAGNYLISPGAPPRQGERRANFGNYRLTRFLIKVPTTPSLSVPLSDMAANVLESLWCESGLWHFYISFPWCESLME